MNITELAKLTKNLADITTIKRDRVVIRNCVDGIMYDIEAELSLAIYGNESIVIIDIKPEGH